MEQRLCTCDGGEKKNKLATVELKNNQEKEQESELAIKVLHLGKEYIVRFPVEADSRFICEAVKTQAGVKGAFYLHGDGVEGYLHSSSLTRANLEKFGSKPVEVRGGGCKCLYLM